MLTPADIDALATGRHADPFAMLGMHERDGHLSVWALLPGARGLGGRRGQRARRGTLAGVNAGIFDGLVPRRRKRFAYRLKIGWMGVAQGGGEHVEVESEDPYRFPAVLGDVDVWLLAEGKHARVYEKLGAHVVRLLGVEALATACHGRDYSLQLSLAPLACLMFVWGVE